MSHNSILPTCQKKSRIGHFFDLKVRRGATYFNRPPAMHPDTQIREDFVIRHLVYLPEAIKVEISAETLSWDRVCIDLRSPNPNVCARTMALWGALSSNPLKGMGTCMMPSGRKICGHSLHFLHFIHTTLVFTYTFCIWMSGHHK